MGPNPWAAGTKTVPLPTATHLQPHRGSDEKSALPTRVSVSKARPYPYFLRGTEADTVSLDKSNRIG